MTTLVSHPSTHAPIAIERDGHRTLLKWHRGRRHLADTAFTARRILECLALGGSVEIDLLVNAAGSFVVLHDEFLEESTTGSGPVCQAFPDQLRSLMLQTRSGEDSGEPVMLLDDLMQQIAENPIGEGAVLQLDLKEGLDAFHDNTVHGFQEAISSCTDHLILSGMHADAVLTLGKTESDLPLGYDPCLEDAMGAVFDSRDFETFVVNALETAPWALMIYLHIDLVLEADRCGFDIVSAFHAAGKQVDAWTIRVVDETTVPKINRLLELRVDQITTDDPQGLYERFV